MFGGRTVLPNLDTLRGTGSAPPDVFGESGGLVSGDPESLDGVALGVGGAGAASGEAGIRALRFLLTTPLSVATM